MTRNNVCTALTILLVLIAYLVRYSGNTELAWFILATAVMPAILAAWKI